ncbi:membrane protein PM19L-like isoform X3 [Diospyros lotus]|uniref:membrane protein PM19L-like isoform X3 n=1 Tax=Diospyros lotus TaxID=55363 RepID=UPI00224F944B|nr:membrane protein PM19L-like isoform X3 [Diospyros lotus]XP_052205800.1 membrane protein PM19L-like isoform X3 [Diospyros lotus]
MAIGRRARSLMGPILTANFVGYLILLGLAGWSLDKFIDDLGGNQSTSFMLVFASLAGAIGVCSVVAGWVHRRAWRSDSLAAAASSAIAGWALTALAFGLVCKEIIMGGHRGKRLVISNDTLLFLSLLCLCIQAIAMKNYLDCSKHWKHSSQYQP